MLDDRLGQLARLANMTHGLCKNMCVDLCSTVQLFSAKNMAACKIQDILPVPHVGQSASILQSSCGRKQGVQEHE